MQDPDPHDDLPFDELAEPARPLFEGWLADSKAWFARLKTPRGIVLCIVLGLIGVWLFTQADPAQVNTPEEVITDPVLRDLAKKGDFVKIRDIAFSDSPKSLYSVAGSLVDDGSPEALQMLKRLCADPDGGLVVTEAVEKLPLPEALSMCKELIHSENEAVRHGAICTLFFLAARTKGFTGPWPQGMARLVESKEAAQQRWRKEQNEGLAEGFEEWIYKDAVSAFICSGDPDAKLGALSEATLLDQLDGELQKQFKFKLKL